jgi:YbgC/YbaW family acyl-CoA thioester hydrolase
MLIYVYNCTIVLQRVDMELNKNIYETEMPVRPDDIDMFQHVHSAKYIDYVLAARYDQMERCYGNPMQEYIGKGLGWVVNSCTINFKRALKLGDNMLTRTQLESVHATGVRVLFSIVNKATNKVCCDGHFDYTLIDLKSGRAISIPEWALERYMLPSTKKA